MNTILEQAKKIVLNVGEFIITERQKFSYIKVEIKGKNDLVSYVDKEAERQLVVELKKIFPEAGFIVEENTASEKKEYNWIIDPLDGTTNFIHGIPSYAISVALEHKGEILLGIVYELNRKELFSAVKNEGAFLNGEKIKVSERKNLSESLIATGFPIQNFDLLENYLACLKYLMQHTHGIRRIGAASVDLCYLACGRVDAFFEYNLKPWDVAAGALIVKEAGGTIHDFSGRNDWLFGKQIVGTNKLVQAEFEEVIKRFFIS